MPVRVITSAHSGVPDNDYEDATRYEITREQALDVRRGGSSVAMYAPGTWAIAERYDPIRNWRVAGLCRWRPEDPWRTSWWEYEDEAEARAGLVECQAKREGSAEWLEPPRLFRRAEFALDVWELVEDEPEPELAGGALEEGDLAVGDGDLVVNTVSVTSTTTTTPGPMVMNVTFDPASGELARQVRRIMREECRRNGHRDGHCCGG